MSNHPIVFLGPSLPRAQALTLLPNATYLPPIRRGDLANLLEAPPPAIAIIDGEFFQSLAISPKEILPFLQSRIPIYGASSIGALRAAELAPNGMQGIGRIFHLYASGRLKADDEVAVTFNPETLQPLSLPLVNLRLALSSARAADLLSLVELITLTRRLKAIYFPNRTLPCLFSHAKKILGILRAQALENWWLQHAPDTKADDARLLLQHLAATICGKQRLR